MRDMRSIIAGILFFLMLPICTPIIYGQMSHMKMYQAGAIDGCTDFHCLKCIDRNLCSRGEHCNMPNCGHIHGAVLCHGGILFYLRNPNGYKDESGKYSCLARAINVANQLNEYLKMMESHDNCHFSVVDKHQTVTIWFAMMMGDGHRHKVVSVTPSDLQGYKYRSNLPELNEEALPANKITKKLVAQWWASNLTDHFRMMVQNKAPHLTTDTNCGKVLLKIWEKARVIVPSGKIKMNVWTQVVEDLSSDDRALLYLASQIVPKNFDPNLL